MVAIMLKSERAWDEVTEMIKTILKQKEIQDRTQDTIKCKR